MKRLGGSFGSSPRLGDLRIWAARIGIAAAMMAIVTGLGGCAGTGRLRYTPEPVAPVKPEKGSAGTIRSSEGPHSWQAIFSGDTLIGFIPGTADTTKRYLGRLLQGYTADTLNIILCGDNRPAYRTSRLKNDFMKVQQMVSPNPVRILRGLITIPILFFKGMFPDFALVRDLSAGLRGMPNYGREQDVLNAIIAKVDSLQTSGRAVAAVINTGDLVKDGRYPAQWERFLRMYRPLTRRVPYMAIAGNHERTDTEDGVENWRTATGLPVTGDRLYYCFDSADGWVRFIALDSNPMTDPANHWTRDVEVKYSDEQIDWMVARVKEHRGPAFVFMHHPPFSTGFHRVEWQNDAVLRERRERMVAALHTAGIGFIASGHEHAYERALLTWPDAVLINIVTGGAGTPLHDIPPQQESARLFSEYKVAGAVIKPTNVYTGEFFHFIHVRLWFGGGDFYTYAVEPTGKVKLIDDVKIDLKRYGVPKIDQKKMPVLEKEPKQPPPLEETKKRQVVTAKSDSLSASKRLKSKASPVRKQGR